MYVMKKALCALFVVFALCMTSCKTIHSTAEYKDPTTFLRNVTVADLEVSRDRISFTYEPSREVRRGGDQNVIKAARREALRVNGGGDVLVDLEYITVSKFSIKFFYGMSAIRQITVSGYPAKYTNFHSLNDSIWAPTKLYPDEIRERTPLKDYLR
mgnify:FL=1